MTNELRLPWGKDETIKFPLPDGWNLKAVLEPDRPAQLPEFDKELDRAMVNPIGSTRLGEFARRGKSACVIIDDRTRPTPVGAILPRAIEEIHQAGIQDNNIVILIALGTHRDMTDDEIRKRVGEDIARKYRVVNHHYLDKNDLVHVGNTPTHGIPVTLNRLAVEADTVLSIGCIEAHEQAGAGGGYKNIMPGIAGAEPIHATHTAKFQKPDRISSSGMPKSKCRFRQAVDEAGALLGPKVFIVNTVLDPVNIVAIVAGDPIAAHEAGRKIHEKMAAVKLDAPADVVIADARPLDIDLRVSMKACFNASPALKPGGLFISVSSAHEGLGDLRVPPGLPNGAKSFIKKMPMAIMEPLAMRINKSPDQAAGTISVIKLLKTAERWLYLTSIPGGVPAFKSIGIEFFNDMTALLARAREIKPIADVVVLPHAGASFIAWD